MKEIQLTQGQVALVDDEDYEELNKYKWQAHKHRNTWYATRTIRRKADPAAFQMHRQILGLVKGDGVEVDHIDGNGLNNTKQNLRIATNAENARNAGIGIRNTSGYKGVIFEKGPKKWRARIMVDSVPINLGLFTVIEDAARAYDKAATKYFKEFARLNFPGEH